MNSWNAPLVQGFSERVSLKLYPREPQEGLKCIFLTIFVNGKRPNIYSKLVGLRNELVNDRLVHYILIINYKSVN